MVRGGRWVLRDCVIASSKRTRATNAIKIREGGCVRLERCHLSRAVAAVSLERAPCALVCTGCTFVDSKDAIVTRGGGCVVVEHSSFTGNDAALLLDDMVHGHAECNVINGSMFGRWARPVGFRCRANTYVSPDDDEASPGHLELRTPQTTRPHKPHKPPTLKVTLNPEPVPFEP